MEKFIGDEVMAVFGVPVVREDDALRAVRAAVEMRDQLPSLETGPGAEGALEVRIGINTGEVVAGDPGTGHGFVTGEAVAIGKRLEQTAGPGEILLGELTHALVSHAVVAIGLEPLKLEGKRHEVTAFRLESVDTGAPASPRRDDAPFVGRQRELTLLRAAWERAKADERCELVTVVGDGGVGKSRLTAEALAGVDARVVSRPLPAVRRGNHLLAGGRGAEATRRTAVRRCGVGDTAVAAGRKRPSDKRGRDRAGRSARSSRSRRRWSWSSTICSGASRRFSI